MDASLLRPLIGITAYKFTRPDVDWPYDGAYAHNAMAIEAAGGLPVLIPARLQDATVRAIYERLDGVLLPGGVDIEPRRYSNVQHETVSRFDYDRDRVEIQLAQWAVADDRPLMGICRGIQVINVALGGTLVQDIPSFVNTDLTHDIDRIEEPRSKLMHTVSVDPHSRLGNIVGETQFPVTSLHHQAIETPAPGAVVTAHAPDGVIEALELPDRRFALAVQWHPEDMPDDERMQRLFSAFVEAARQRMVTRLAAP